MKWQKKLTKKELKHFRYATNGIMTLQSFKRTRDYQVKKKIENEKDYPDLNSEPCYECRDIAKKLGMD